MSDRTEVAVEAAAAATPFGASPASSIIAPASVSPRPKNIPGALMAARPSSRIAKSMTPSSAWPTNSTRIARWNQCQAIRSSYSRQARAAARAMRDGWHSAARAAPQMASRRPSASGPSALLSFRSPSVRPISASVAPPMTTSRNMSAALARASSGESDRRSIARKARNNATSRV